MSYRLGLLHGALLVGLLLAIFVVSHADDWLVVSGVAKHLDGQAHCNSTTSGLAWEHNDYIAGFYRNSNCRYSAYAAKSWLPLQYSHWRFGTVGGLATGYKYNLTPAGGLAATYELQHVGLNLLYVPQIQNSGNVLWASVKFKW